MSIFKNKRFGLWLVLLTVTVSLALASLLSAVAQNDELLDTYYKVNISVNDETYGTVQVTGGVQDGEGNFRYGTDVVLTAVPKDSGYVFIGWEGSTISSSNPLSITVTSDCSYKAVFEPMSYTIEYENSSNLQYAPGTVIPRKHTHGKPTMLPRPLDTPGYTFAGWTAVSGEKTNEYNIGDSLGANEYQANIKLYPIFRENQYDVTCYDVIGSKDGQELGSMVKPYQYKGESIPLTFWDVKTYSGYTFSSYVDLSEPVRVNTLYNRVYRIYTANKYTVLLNKNAAGAIDGDASVTVTYDQPFPVVENAPKRAGYTFVGYFLDANNNGRRDNSEKMYCSYDLLAGTWSYEKWDIADGATLSAEWHKNDYSISFAQSILQYFTDVTIRAKHLVDDNNNPIYYDYRTDVIPYNTELIITVRVQDGYKLVEWNGDSSIRHTAYGSFEYTILGETTISGLVLDESAIPAFKIDYFNELFVYEGGTIPAGTYRLEDASQNLLLKFSVDANGTLTYTSGSSLSASDLLGTTVYMIRCGDGVEYADSKPKTLALVARPGEVQFDRNSVYPKNENQTTIRIVFPDSMDLSGLEFACSTDENNLVWQSTPVFENLRNGTPYYVYVRVAATATAPHGVMKYVGQATTDYDKYVQDQIDKIIDWKHEGIIGENVDALVSGAVEELRALEASATFYDDANAIVTRVWNNLSHARVQDQAIADLTAKYNELVGSGKYAENLGLPALKTLYENAKASIGAATTASAVEAVRTETLTKFDLVPISYLYVNEDMRLYVTKGMDKEYRLAMSRVVDLASISAKIQRAVSRGTIVPVGLSMTYAELGNALKTMDVLGYYQLRLSYKSDAAIRTPAEGPYQMRLLLPEDLRDDSGFMVAYYNSVTEEMTVLETVREGNYLIFDAPQSVEDFVILGDHAVNMIPVFAALLTLFVAQIVALAVILSSRRKVRRQARMNGFAIPAVALTIRFFPMPIAKAVVLLAGLVIILQIVLTVLLIKLDLIPRGRRRRYVEAPAHREQPADSDLPEETPVSEAEMPAEAEEYTEEAYEIESDVDATETDAAEASVDGEDFAEPADAPSYAMADDWFEDDAQPLEEGEEINGYSMEYDEDSNGYSLEYDNQSVEYTDEEFDGTGEGFVEYSDAESYEYAEDTTEAYEESFEESYEEPYEEAYEEAYEELSDYGYDQAYGEDETEVVYDYVTAEDVVRDEDYVPVEEDEDVEEDEFFEM